MTYYYSKRPSGPLYPSLVGQLHVIHDSGSAGDKDIDWSGLSLQPGDKGLLAVARGNSDTLTTPTDFSLLNTRVPRPSTTAGENMSLFLFGVTFDSTIIASLKRTINMSNYSQMKMAVFRDCPNLTWDGTYDASTGPQNANSRPLRQPTLSNPATVIQILAGSWSNAKATNAAATGWTAGSAVPQFSNSGAAGRYGLQFLYQDVQSAVSAGTITTSGAADAYLVAAAAVASRY